MFAEYPILPKRLSSLFYQRPISVEKALFDELSLVLRLDQMN